MRAEAVAARGADIEHDDVDGGFGRAGRGEAKQEPKQDERSHAPNHIRNLARPSPPRIFQEAGLKADVSAPAHALSDILKRQLTVGHMASAGAQAEAAGRQRLRRLEIIFQPRHGQATVNGKTVGFGEGLMGDAEF